MNNPVDAPPAILHTDPSRRLDAIVRRLGGTPKPAPAAAAPSRPTFPPLRPHTCAGQLDLTDATALEGGQGAAELPPP